MNRKPSTKARRRSNLKDLQDAKNRLGMAYGSARAKLNRTIVFELLKVAGRTDCIRCGEPMTEQDWSVDHIEKWRPDPALFWDWNNIGFSHLLCNILDGRQSRYSPRANNPDGRAWCGNHKEYLDRSLFWVNKAKPTGVADTCAECSIERRRKARAKRKRLTKSK